MVNLPTSSIPTLSIPTLSILTIWELTKWELTKWMVRGEVQVSVYVGELSVDAYVKGFIVLAMEECVQER